MGRIVNRKFVKPFAKRKRARIEKVRARNRRLEKAALLDEWNEAAAKCVGSSHLATGTPCQDSVCTKSFMNGVSAVSLADGAGSSRFSHYGSSLVVNRAVELIGEHFFESIGSRAAFDIFKIRLINQLQLDLLRLSETGIDFDNSERLKYGLPSREEQLFVPCNIEDLSCTFLAAATYGNRYFVIHLGDGVVGSEIKTHGQRWMRVISVPDNGEFANETVFLTSKDAVAKSRGFQGKLDNASEKTTGFILMSDGPEAALFDKRSQMLAAACHKLIAANRDLEQVEMNLQLEATLQEVIAKKTSDDCSIALMSRWTK